MIQKKLLSLNAIVFMLALLLGSTATSVAQPIRVLVWDERQPEQKSAYPDFLGNHIAAHLRTLPGISVQSVGIDDPQQGLGDLENWDVLIWWGHRRHDEITSETARKIVERIQTGRLSLIALHSAHWSTPFMEAMAELTRQEARRRYPGSKVRFDFMPPPGRVFPAHDSLVTPAFYAYYSGNVLNVRVDLPNCVFPGVRGDGKPSRVTVLKPDHPIAAGLPAQFEIPMTEAYLEPFHVPAPDAVVFQETWGAGGWFRSGMVWNLGKGKVFYFRPGHETFKVFHEEIPLKIMENAVRWLGTKEHAH